MQSCARFEGALYEGQITPEVSEHLAQCGSCRELAGRLDQLDQTARFDVTIDPRFAEFRRNLILQRLATLQVDPPHAWALKLLRMALVAAIALALFLPHNSAQKQTKPARNAAEAAIDFELVKDGDIVQLRWKGDPHREYCVFKGPNPGQLAPVQQVRGVAWVDDKPDSSPILFYKIEAL